VSKVCPHLHISKTVQNYEKSQNMCSIISIKEYL